MASAMPGDEPPPYEPNDKFVGQSDHPKGYNACPTQQPGPSYQQQQHQGYITSQQQVLNPATTIVVTETSSAVQYTAVYGYTSLPVSMNCPKCHANIVTVTHSEPGTLTWFIFGLLMILCCWLFAWVPFVDKSTQDVIHTCPNCGSVVGRFKRM